MALKLYAEGVKWVLIKNLHLQHCEPTVEPKGEQQGETHNNTNNCLFAVFAGSVFLASPTIHIHSYLFVARRSSHNCIPT